MSIGPEDSTKLVQHKKTATNLIITFKALLIQSYKITINIDCNKNSFSLTIKEIPDKSKNISSASNIFYIYFNAECKHCLKTYCSSSDIEIDILNSKIGSCELERDAVLVNIDNRNYLIFYRNDTSCDPSVKKMFIYDCKYEYDLMTPKIGTEIEIPITKFDYSDLDKVIQKIKTLLIFS